MVVRSFIGQVFSNMVRLVNRPAVTHPSTANNFSQVGSPFSDGIFIDENSRITVHGHDDGLALARWDFVHFCVDDRPTLILKDGEKADLAVQGIIEKDTMLFTRFSASSPQLTIQLSYDVLFIQEGAAVPQVIASFHLNEGQQPVHWREAQMDLSHLAGMRGSFALRCSSGHITRGNEAIGVADFCVARSDHLPLVKARSNNQIRFRNELSHFGHVYDHRMYSDTKGGQENDVTPRILRKLEPVGSAPYEKSEVVLKLLDPKDGESAFEYGSRLLAMNIPQPRPDFPKRLKDKAQKGKTIRVLSLCCGAARVEASYAAFIGKDAEWTLMDINPTLLETASRHFPPDVKVDLVEANVNDILPTGEKWDVIMCVSAVHHVVELERLARFCFHSLEKDGELWLIGECVGRNGNQLWPETLAEADRIFRALPEKYRHNRNTGKMDRDLPVNDYSVGCYEGIRSEDIEPVFDRWFLPLDVLRENCFLWRLLDLAYNDNYNTSNMEDRAVIEQLVRAELAHFRDGGRGTELFGVYAPRPLW